MLRLTGIQLPLNHGPEAIAKAAAARLRIAPADLVSCTVFRRAHDARKNFAIMLIYSLDVAVKDEAAVLRRFEKDAHVRVRFRRQIGRCLRCHWSRCIIAHHNHILRQKKVEENS